LTTIWAHRQTERGFGGWNTFRSVSGETGAAVIAAWDGAIGSVLREKILCGPRERPGTGGDD
jgi:hypothetical protein